MPLYLVRFRYTADAWQKLVESPEDRRGPVGELIESLGGEMKGFWYSFGNHDGFVIADVPDNVSAAALSIAASAGHGSAEVDTTVLLTVEEFMEALNKASATHFHPPGDTA